MWTIFFSFFLGYFNKTVSGDSWAYCKDRVKRLLVPYITWSIIGAIVYFGMIALFPYIFVKGKMAGFEWSHLWNTSHSYGNGPCWFLMSFFTAYIAIHFIEKVRYLHWLILLFPFVSYWLYTIDRLMQSCKQPKCLVCWANTVVPSSTRKRSKQTSIVPLRLALVSSVSPPWHKDYYQENTTKAFLLIAG